MFSNDHQNSTYIIYECEYQNGVEKVILWLYNMYEKISSWGGSSYESCKNFSRRTPRPQKSILRILRSKNWFQRYMMSIKNISDGVVVLMNHVRTSREELLHPKNSIFRILRTKKWLQGYMMWIKIFLMVW